MRSVCVALHYARTAFLPVPLGLYLRTRRNVASTHSLAFIDLPYSGNCSLRSHLLYELLHSCLLTPTSRTLPVPSAACCAFHVCTVPNFTGSLTRPGNIHLTFVPFSFLNDSCRSKVDILQLNFYRL